MMSPAARAIFNRIMESPEENLLATMDDGIAHLLRPETRNYGIVAEGLSADYLRSRVANEYSNMKLNECPIFEYL